MDNIAQTNNLQLIEQKLKKISLQLNNDTLNNKEDVKLELIALEKENNQFKQRIITYTAALMHQRRKAAQNVDDQYFEHEVFIEAHEELAHEIKKQLKLLERLN